MKNKLFTILIVLILLSSSALGMGNVPGQQDNATTTGVKEKEYDGVWFLGFNMNKKLFGDEDGRVVRQAFSMAVNRGEIGKIIGDETVPIGIIPPGMEGYDPNLKGYPYDTALAKKMMRSAGYSLSDKRLKTLTILHTDGKKTKEIVDQIKRDLVNIGVDLYRIEVSYADSETWKKSLSSGKYDLFVMGYKAGNFGELYIGDKDTKIFHDFSCHLNPTDEAKEVVFEKYDDAVSAGYSACETCKPTYESMPNTISLLQPLFHSQGEANFTFYSNKRVDALIDKIALADKRKNIYRIEMLNEIDSTIMDDCPVIPLFYITKL